MSFLEPVISYFTSSRKLSTKAATGFFILFLILAVDNIAGFSFHYNNQRKIEELKELTAITQNPATDSASKSMAATLRNKLMSRKSLGDYLSWHNDDYTSNQTKQNHPGVYPAKDKWVFRLTASSVFFLIAFLALPFSFYDAKDTPLFVSVITAIVSCITFIIVGLVWEYLLNNIPRLAKTTWIYNYILNGFIQLLFASYFVWYGLREVKKDEKSG